MPASQEMLKTTSKISLVALGTVAIGAGGALAKHEDSVDQSNPNPLYFEQPLPEAAEGHISHKAMAVKIAIKRVIWEEHRREERRREVQAKQQYQLKTSSSSTTIASPNGLPSILITVGQCESGGGPGTSINYSAQNPSTSASGGFQIMDETWAGFGGYQHAKDAPPAVQIAKAQQLYASSGTGPWAASAGCWGG
jgi:hypothetical protein